mgnify:CR=1 FL=1
MEKKQAHIGVYLPADTSRQEVLNANWQGRFKKMLEMNLYQLTGKKVAIEGLDSSTNKEDLAKKLENYTVILQLIPGDAIQESHLLHNAVSDNSLLQHKLYQVLTGPGVSIQEEMLSESAGVFHFYDEGMGRSFDMEHYFTDKNIWLKMLDFSRKLRKKMLDSGLGKKDYKASVYLALTTADQRPSRELIVRELEHLGYRVLPNRKIPTDLVEFSDAVYEALNSCFLSIHIMGNHYEPLSKNLDVSAIELQNDVFNEVEAERSGEIFRLVWLPPDLRIRSEKQKKYIESFKRNIDLLRNTEIIQTPVENFKTLIGERAEKLLEQKKSDKPIEESKEERVYFISNHRDSSPYDGLKEELRKKNLTILESPPGKQQNSVQEHYRMLVKADAVVIHYGEPNQQWLQSKLSDVLKSPGFGKKNKFKFKALCYETATAPDMRLRVPNLRTEQLTDKNIKPFIASFIEKMQKNGD